MSTPTRTTRPPAPAPAASRPSPSRAAAPAGAASRMGSAPVVRLTPQPVGGTLSIGEVDLSSGQLLIPEATAAEAKVGRDLEVPVRLPGLAEGTIKVRKRGETFNTTGAGTAIRLAHPALAPLADAVPTTLVVVVKDNVVTGWVGVGQPGPVRGSRRALVDGMLKSTEALGLLGMTRITVPRVVNEFTAGRINLAVENMGFRLGGYLEGTGSLKLDNQALQVEGGAKIDIPGCSGGELRVRRGSDGKLGGDLRISVTIGPASGAVVAKLADGFVHVQGTVGYRNERMGGTITLIATDEKTARDLTTRTDLDPSALPVAPPGEGNPPKPGKRAFCGWGELTITLTPWLSGRARVLVNSQAQATIIGEVRPQKELILFPEKEWNKRLFKLEIRAGYGVPVIGQVGVFANIGLEALAKVGPGKIHNMSASGQFSTDPRVENLFVLEGSVNISAFAGLRLRAEGGVVITVLGHDLKAGVGLNALAGVRGYVDAVARIGRRMNAAGKPEWFIGGHMEIAAQPFLGFSGDLFVELDSPWWSPAPDKKWTWPLFSLEYPLPGEFGIGADVDYVLGSRTWPTVQFGEVDFDSSKFMTDLLANDVSKGSGGERRKPGTWREGTGGGAPGGARGGKGRGGRGENTESFDGPIGETMTFSDGAESHRLFIKEEARGTTTMMASEVETLEAKLTRWQGRMDLLADADKATVRTLLPQARDRAHALDQLTDEQKTLKEAEKNAKATHDRHKGTKRKRSGQNQKKKPSEMKRRVQVAQAALTALVKQVSTLTADEAFKPVDRQARLHGGSEPVQLGQKDGRARLRVADSDEALALAAVSAGEAMSRAFNQSGPNLVRTTRDTVQARAEKFKVARIIGGRINRRVRRSLDAPLGDVMTVVASLGRTMQIARLARALRTIPVAPRTLEFHGNPFQYPDKSSPRAQYRTAFRKEMARQLKLQQRGINGYTVDRWLKNLLLFRMDATLYRMMDMGGREAVLKALKERAAKALEVSTDRQKDLDERLKGIRAELDRLAQDAKTLEKLKQELAQAKKTTKKAQEAVGVNKRKLERNVKATEKQQGLQAHWEPLLALANERLRLAQVAVDRILKAQGSSDLLGLQVDDGVTVQRELHEDLRPRRTDLGGTDEEEDEIHYHELRVIGRQGNEVKVREKLSPYYGAMAKRVGLWNQFIHLKNGFGTFAVLHNPDQVAGGEDSWPEFKLPPGKNFDDKAWTTLFQKMRRYVGNSKVNSQIGDQWKKRMNTEAQVIMKLLPPQSHPIWKNNFRFVMTPPEGKP
ncbi:polymorphic toxin type 15 domain-containing protein [Pyxidicoccus xibeiensis]|uniref:polymorphic toxin type 15 domain-containing protein n=1 Tax=Pyxidicoccus xibeiensis TaxID=2906759 RepID=UPI0020A774C1|nr:polymorphic toxin type 15 domain-containing protein [Pyxidicoccus xibeiensis]MCP3143948.1 polymorphic toxin type 15 domain-containing protein [Pyxidicoccus xibeiensis]